MKTTQTFIHFIAVAMLLLISCGGSQEQRESRRSGTTVEKVTLPNDPCELIFHVMSTMNKGPETFEAAFLNVNDFKQLKKDFPDLEKYYELWVKHFYSTMTKGTTYYALYHFPRSELMQMEFLDRKAAEKNINFADHFNKFVKEIYLGIREIAINEQWIWDEIRLNDCKTKYYPPVDFIRVDYEGESDDYLIDESEFLFPEIGETSAFIIINGEVTEWDFITVKTKQGLKLFLPYLHSLRDQIVY